MLRISHITKSYPGLFQPVLQDINVELQQGEFCVIIGSNGSGKSTLFRIIADEIQADSGEIFINGHIHKERNALIASVVQDVHKGTVPELTLLENMRLSAMRGKKARFALYTQFESDIKLLIQELGLGLEHYMHKPLSSLSGGQRQMIATLMAFTSNPLIMLLDEHLSALDPKMQYLLMEYTARAIHMKKITTLMITHKLDDAITYGNRLIMLHKGQIVLDIAGEAKAKLKVAELLALFHKYEDLILTHDVQHDI